MKLNQLKIGDKLSTWHHQGANMGSVIIGCEVIKLGKVKVRVRDDMGNEAWVYPSIFTNRMSDETFAELKSEQ